MRRFAAWAGALGAGTLLVMLATLLAPVGASAWHYNASFVGIIVIALAATPLLKRRRVATLTMAFSGILATVTGFAMLYTKQFAYKEWITWWHSVTSFVLLVAFVAHWLHNQTRFWDLARRLFGGAGLGLAVVWGAILAFAAWSGLPEGRAGFTSENYLVVSSWTILACVAGAYGVWLAYRLPALQRRVEDSAHRNRLRGLVDVSLFLAHWGALVSGLALVWFADFLRGDSGFKYVSKWWHTGTSALFLAILAIHIGFNARFLAAHARRVDAELGA